MAETKQALCIVEVCESQAVAQALGRRAAAKLMEAAINGLSESVIAGGGSAVKVLADTVMFSFPHPSPALEATRFIQEAAQSMVASAGPQTRPALRAGVHWGQVIAHGKDLFGEAVNVAAQLTSMAKPGQILTTGATLEFFNPTRGATLRFLTPVPLTGSRQDADIYEVVWLEGQSTIQSPTWPGYRVESGPVMVLTCGDAKVEVGSRKPVVVMGRGQQSDLVVQGGWVSRLHARVEMRQNRFYLVDQSTNGTHLFEQGQEPDYLKLGERELSGPGVIVLGDTAGQQSQSAVQFYIEQP